MLRLQKRLPLLANDKKHFLNNSQRFLTDRVVIIGGLRIPFSKSGHNYFEMDLVRISLETVTKLWRKYHLENNFVEYGIYGNAVQNAQFSNIGLQLMEGLRSDTVLPCHAINSACLSSLLATTSASDFIKSGMFGAVIAGGFEFMSDQPIGMSKKFVKKDLSRFKNPLFFFKHKIYNNDTNNGGNSINTGVKRNLFMSNLLNIRFPALTDFHTNRTMIDECEFMCRKFGISRHEADSYSLLSYTRALYARDNQLLTDVEPVKFNHMDIVYHDDTIRETSMEKLGSLSGVSSFSKRKGKKKISEEKDYCVVTAGNASRPADGGAIILMSSEKKALDFGYQPRAILKDYEISSHSPDSNFLLGTAYSIARLMKKNNLKFSDIGIWEIHEPFAGQVIAVLKCLNSPEFLKNEAKVSEDLGQLTPEDINHWGGTLAFGHPLAATGARLVNMAVERLHYDNKQYAIVAACSPGSMGTAILLENYTPLK